MRKVYEDLMLDPQFRNADVLDAINEALVEQDVGLLIVESHSERIRFANRAFCLLSGYTSEELLKMNSIFDLSIPGEQKKLQARAAMRDENVPVIDSYRTKCKTKSGLVVDIEVAVKKVPGSNSLFVSLIKPAKSTTSC